MNIWIIIVSVILVIFFVQYMLTSSTLKKINKDKECNKDLVQSKLYSATYYSTIILAVLLVLFAAYYIYTQVKGKPLFYFLNKGSNANKLMESLKSENSGLKPLVAPSGSGSGIGASSGASGSGGPIPVI